MFHRSNEPVIESTIETWDGSPPGGGGGGNGEGEDEMKLEGGKGGEIHNCRLRILRDPKQISIK